MKPLTSLLVAACVLFAAASALAAPISVQETGSAFIKAAMSGTPPWYSSNLNGNTLPTGGAFLGGNPAASEPIWAMVLWKFNLSSWSGLTFNGNVTVRAGMNWGEAGVLPFRLYTVVSNWDELTVTWENFLGPDAATNGAPYPDNNQLYTNVLGVELALQNCDGTTPTAGGYTNALGTNFWVFPGSMIQYMLDNPANNQGFALIPDRWANKMWWCRKGSWSQIKIPVLEADVVPEPALMLLGCIAMFLGLRRR